MRLIDADSMLKRIEVWNTKDNMDRALYNFALILIVEQPTAYDVDKVVEELWESYGDNRISNAIDIVRRGGVDEHSR